MDADSSFRITDKYGASYAAHNDLNNNRWEMHIGGSAMVGKNTYVYADVEKSFGGNIDKKWQYNVGVRHSF